MFIWGAFREKGGVIASAPVQGTTHKIPQPNQRGRFAVQEWRIRVETNVENLNRSISAKGKLDS